MLRPRAKWPQSNATTETKSNTTRTNAECARTPNVHARRTCTRPAPILSLGSRARRRSAASFLDIAASCAAYARRRVLLQLSAHATRGAQCHYLSFRRAASPPLRPRPLSSTRCSHRMCHRRRAHGRSNCTNSTGSVPGPFCDRAGSAPALARAWTAPCRFRPRPNRRRDGLQLERRSTAPRARRLVGQRHEILAGPGAANAGVAAPRAPHTLTRLRSLQKLLAPSRSLD